MLEQMIMQNPLWEEMKENAYKKENTIYMCDEFDRDSCNVLVRQITKLCEKELAKAEEKREHVKIMISSYGGHVYDFFRVASVMEYYKKRGIIIETIADGYSCSAGAKMLIMGSKGYRKCTKYCHILLHQIQTGQYGAMTLQEKIMDAKETEKLWATLKGIIKENTNLSDEEIEDFTRLNMDVSYSPKEALEKGLIDEIIL